jgi:hypothetical protein
MTDGDVTCKVGRFQLLTTHDSPLTTYLGHRTPQYGGIAENGPALDRTWQP